MLVLFFSYNYFRIKYPSFLFFSLSPSSDRYTIGKINVSDSDNFLASSNVFDVAERIGMFDPSGTVEFDFAQIFRSEGGHALPGYPNHHLMRDRRRWEVFRVVAPSVYIDPYDKHTWDDSDFTVPFSIKPDHLLSERDVFRIHRDTFQGTEFDISLSAITGPYGDPFRGKLAAPFNETVTEFEGSFERSVSQLWTSYTVRKKKDRRRDCSTSSSHSCSSSCSFLYLYLPPLPPLFSLLLFSPFPLLLLQAVSQSRDFVPDSVGGRFFFGPHSARTSLFVPVYVNAGKLTNKLPSVLEEGSLLGYTQDSFWWAVTITANYAARFMSYNLQRIDENQERLENEMLRMAKEAEEAAEKEEALVDALEIIQTMQEEVSQFAFDEW